MRHLFIVNPASNKIIKNAPAVVDRIEKFFKARPELAFDIHLSRWERDALGYARRYVQSVQGETVRIHILGGTGTLFEIVNGIIDLPNAQIAIYPMGKANTFLHYFGSEKAHLFNSLESQAFSDTIKIDAIRCNHNYSISSGLIGIEAYVDREGDKLIKKTRLPYDLCYLAVALPALLKQNRAQRYKVTLDGKSLDGDYLSLMIANQPWYAMNMCPGIDARPNDGILDVYMIKDSRIYRRLTTIPAYIKGKYYKYPEYCSHYTGRKVSVSTDKLVCLSVDGETFYGNNIECEIMPGAINFVCPNGALPGTAL